MRKFCVLHWEEIIKNIPSSVKVVDLPSFVIVPPRNEILFLTGIRLVFLVLELLVFV